MWLAEGVEVTTEEMGHMVTTSTVAEMLHIHINTVRRWSDQGILKPYRIGPRGDRRFTQEDVNRFLTTAQYYKKPDSGKSSYLNRAWLWYKPRIHKQLRKTKKAATSFGRSGSLFASIILLFIVFYFIWTVKSCTWSSTVGICQKLQYLKVILVSPLFRPLKWKYSAPGAPTIHFPVVASATK